MSQYWPLYGVTQEIETNATKPRWRKGNIGSDYGLVRSITCINVDPRKTRYIQSAMMIDSLQVILHVHAHRIKVHKHVLKSFKFDEYFK